MILNFVSIQKIALNLNLFATIFCPQMKKERIATCQRLLHRGWQVALRQPADEERKRMSRRRTKKKTRKRRRRRKLLTNVCRESCVSCQLSVVLFPTAHHPSIHRPHCPDSQPTTAPSTSFLFLLPLSLSLSSFSLICAAQKIQKLSEPCAPRVATSCEEKQTLLRH